MVNKWVATPTNNNIDNEDAMTKMCAAMDGLLCHNKTLEDKFLHFQKFQ